MKKLIIATVVFSLILALTACGSNAGTSNSSTSLALEGQLLVGTFKLEDTNLAVTADQAAELLPLWEALQSLANSSIAANQEVEAVVAQIKSSMSPEQIDRITAMQLTQSDLAAAMAQVSETSSTSSSTSTTSSSSAQPQAGSGMAAPGDGDPPADMGAGGAVVSADSSATQAVASQPAAASDQIPTALISSLVELLQKKIG